MQTGASSSAKINQKNLKKKASSSHSKQGRSSHKLRAKKFKSQGKRSPKSTPSTPKRRSGGLSFEKRFTASFDSPYLKHLQTRRANTQIRDSDGKMIFELNDLEVPKDWSQLAVDILGSKYVRKAGVPKSGHEISVKQVVRRIAKTIAKEGVSKGYFDPKNSEIFEDELSFLLANQYGAFNSPVWFNLGLWHEYGIESSGGNFFFNPAEGKTIETGNAYEHPQCSACFIQSIEDDLMSIFDLVKSEARLFKHGSGTGTNFSKIRGYQENLSGGGTSSGLMSFLEVFDRGAGATKSGGTTRRAAKMVCLDMDHPEIEDFILWKVKEEKKVKALIDAGYSSDFNGEAYRTVSGQNSNNSVRVTDDFLRAVEGDEKWETRARTTGEKVHEYSARDLWRKIADAAWSCADPGLQFDSTINRWHTCADTDRINASNPCSEYMFLDDTACNLSSLNLVKFLREDGSFDIDGYRSAIRVFIVAQEILVGLSSYPTAKIAKNSHDYRPLGLGFANLGTLLMIKGLPYDSEEGRTWAAALTAILCGHAYAVSAEEAELLGPFRGFRKNRDSMIRVMNQHREAAEDLPRGLIPEELVDAAITDWNLAVKLGEKSGYRNAQATVLAPTGTIGLLMDCDTTGVEPDFSLVKFKKLAGGGYFKIVNQSVPLALKNLGYPQKEIDAIIDYVLGRMRFEGAPHLNRELLLKSGWSSEDVKKVEKQLPSVFEIRSAFTRFSLGDEFLDRLEVPKDEYERLDFNYLDRLELSDQQIDEAGDVICGRMTVEGAPFLKEEHLPVFDCANKCGKTGQRFIAPMGHVNMMSAVQPFLSGAISKTVNLPHETSVEEVQDIYLQAWKKGLKAIALYRDGSKLSQPLSARSDKKESKEKESEKEFAEAMSTLTQQMSFGPVRRKLPNKRSGFTQEAYVAGHKIYVRTGEFEDGKLGEIFIDMHKEGAAYRSMMNCFAVAVSLGLQYGVPIEEFVNKFTFTRFEPAGMVEGHPNIKMATSIVDYIFRLLGLEYLGRTDFLQVKPKAIDLTGERDAPESQDPKDPSKAIRSGIPLEGMSPQLELGIKAKTSGSSKLEYLADMMGDAPLCDQCGNTTVRNGSCYRCLNCGNSLGCS